MGDDPMINRPDGYAVLANVPGTAPFTQRQTGIAYDPASGTVTVRLADSALPAGFGPGSRFILTGARLSAGPNLLAGAHVVAGAAGNSFTFSGRAGRHGQRDRGQCRDATACRRWQPASMLWPQLKPDDMGDDHSEL